MGLILNGINYSREEICLLSNEKLKDSEIPQFQVSLYSFILEWFNDVDFIIAKTSGSTGKPKEVRLLKRDLETSAKRTLTFFNLKAGKTALLCMSVDFIAGKLMVVRSLVGGLNLISVNPSGNPLKDLNKLKLDFAAMVPLQVYNCLNNNVSSSLLEHVGTLIIGGGELAQEAKQKLGKFSNSIYLTYGMTETLTHVAVQKISGKEIESYFNLLPGFGISIDDRGCMIIQTDYDGVDKVHTNDMVNILDYNRFNWLGRYDNVVNSGGVKFFPETIEKKIGDNLLGRRFFISGEKDERFGNVLILVIEGKPFDKNQMDKVNINLSTQLIKMETPKKIIYVPKFFETPTKKIQRVKTLSSV